MVGLTTDPTQLDYGVEYQRGPQSVTQASGLAGLAAPSANDIARSNANALNDMRNFGAMKFAPAPKAPAMPQGPVLAISRSSGKVWANGKLFTLDDAQGALESEQYLSQPPAPAPAAEAGDWEPLSMEALSQHLQGIKNPGLGTLASKNFGIGVDNMQMLGGYGLQFLGAEETGQAIVRSQLEDLNKSAPYQRNFTDIGSDPNRGVLDWFVANLAQQGPNLVESVVTAAAGALAGGAAGGGANPFTAAGGAITAMVGKQAFKQAVLAAAKKHAAGEALDAAESKLLFEAAGLTAAAKRELYDRVGNEMVTNTAGVTRVFGPEDAIGAGVAAAVPKVAAGGLAQARLGGAALATGAQNYMAGVSDLYGDSIEGNDPSRGLAALGGIPYAAMETVPEYLAALRFFKGLGMKASQAGGRLGRAGTIGTNVGIGVGVGAGLEGATELGQEGLGIGMNAELDFDSPEGLSRLLNAFAAGAAIGGFIGGASSLNKGKAHDLLSGGTKPAEQRGETILTGEVIDPNRPRSPVGPDGSVPLLGGPGAAAAPMLGGSAAPAQSGAGVSGVGFAQPQIGTPATPVSPSPGPAQPNMLQSPAPQLPAPPGPAQAAPAGAAPDVIPLPGQIGGSALQQVATGQLEGGIPPALPNRLQQARAAAQQRRLEATSGSALARLARGDLPVPLTQPGGTAAMQGEATGQQVPTMAGKARLKRGKKVMQVEGMPPAAAEPEIDATINQTDEAPMQGDLAPAEEVSQFPVHDKFIADFDDARLNDASKVKLRALVKKAAKQGVLTERDIKELNLAFSDKDQSADDIAPLAAQMIEANKEAAPDAAKAGVRPPDDKLKRTRDDKLVPPDGEARLIEAGERRGSEKASNRGRLRKSKEETGQAEEQVSPKAEGAAAAPSKKADEPGTAVAVVEPKGPAQDPEIALREAKKLRDELEQEATARALSDDYEIIREVVVDINRAEPGSREFYDGMEILLAYTKDQNEALRNFAKDIIKTNIDPDDIKLYERTHRPPKGRNKKEQQEAADNFDRDIIVTAMQQFNAGENILTPTVASKLREVWKRIKDKGIMYGDTPLAAYIKKGDPRFFNIVKGKVEPQEPGRYSLSMWDSPDNPVPAGRIRLIIQKFTSKLAMRPKVHVFRNQADLKTSDPKLYARLKAGRDAGDFDTANAAGYSMGDTVVIFSDRIGSEQHLAFVLAHETLGHFGLRGLMGAGEFNALMDKLYDSDPSVKAYADAAMSARGMPKAEAVEEYLADYAGQLNTRLVLRVWKGIKGVLNRVGIRFGDEATRYLLDQAKRYVRTGQKAGVFNTSSVVNRMWVVEHGMTGRFSMVGMTDENERVNRMIRHDAPWVPMSLKEAAGKLKDFGGSWDGFKQQFFSLLKFDALRNPGLYEFSQLLAEATEREQYIHNKYNEVLSGLLYKNEKYKAEVSRALLLGREVSVFRLLEKPLSPADRRNKLFNIDPNPKPGEEGKLIRNSKAIEEFTQRGILSYEELTKGGSYFRTTLNEFSKPERREIKFEGMPDLTKEQYDDYVLSRRAIANVEIELLEAKYNNFLHSEGVSRGAIKKMLKSAKVEGDAAKLMTGVSKWYKEIYVSGYTVDARGNITPGLKQIKEADDFLVAINKALIDAGPEDRKIVGTENIRKFNDEAVRKFFDSQKQADDFMATLDAVRKDRKIPDDTIRFLFQDEVKRLILDDLNLGVEEERAKRTMAAGYVPVIRDKPFQMRVIAKDKNDNNVNLHEDHVKLLIYSQFDNVSTAQQNAEMLAKEFEGKTFEALVRQDDGSFGPQEVKLVVEYGAAPTQVTADPALNLDEFMHGLRLFGFNIPPDKMTQIIKTLTEAGDPVRKRLEFNNVPGADKSTGVFAMSRHIQMRAATIAKTITRPRMRELLDADESRVKWNGNAPDVIQTYKNWVAATDPAQKQHLRHELDRKLYMFKETNPTAKEWDGSDAGYQKIKAQVVRESNYQRFYGTAQKTMEFLEGNRLVSESNFGTGRVVTALRAGTSILQLGGSIAQGVMNLASPYTNWMPYMASYNSRNGFGGGFSAGAVVSEYHRAMWQVGASGLAQSKYNTAAYYEVMLNDKAALDASGLTFDEAKFLAEEIREGKLIPAQANALLGTARSGISNPWALNALDAFMAPFNRSEQAARRSAALAAFRLAMKRNGGNVKNAREFAIQSLDLTLGEYSVLNRPPAWRDGIQSFLYMYKVYPTTTIQLFRRLDKKGQVVMLGSMLMLAGVPGFPFAEDIEDLVDTIAQMLGLQIGSIRAEFAKVLDGIAPGLTPVVLKGFINGWLGVPADIAGRFSMGDFIPGTGILLSGASVGEEVKDILGPMPAMTIGLATMARDMITAPLSEGKSAQDILRASPMTAMRMAGDTWAYWDNGAVVDRRGYVVSPDMNAGIMAMRLMGFYPRAAAEQYGAIKIAKRVNNYQKEVVAYHRYAWVKAMQTGNRAYARQIERSVEEWNRGAKGTALEIRDFVKNSQRALKEAKLSATQRTLRSTAKAGREDTERVMDILIQ